MSLQHTLEQLIRFKTVTGNHEAVHEAFDWIKNQVSVAPLYIKEYDIDGFRSLAMTTKRTKSPKVWLVAHVDVVPGSEAMFHPRVESGALIGRGAMDMKFAIACYIELMKELGAEARKFDMGLLLVSDEEMGSPSGVPVLLKKHGIRGEVVFLPDFGGVWEFEEAAKGIYVCNVEAHGEAAHSSVPWKGESAIRTLHDFLRELELFILTLAKSDEWCPTINVGQFSGGTAFNQVPDHATARFDIRYPESGDLKRIQREINRLLKKYPKVQVESFINQSAYGIPRTNGEVRAFKRIAEEKYGIEIGWIKCHGTSDARFFAEYDIPSLLIRPNSGGAHSEHEWIDLEDFSRYYEVMKEWVMTVGRK